MLEILSVFDHVTHSSTSSSRTISALFKSSPSFEFAASLNKLVFSCRTFHDFEIGTVAWNSQLADVQTQLVKTNTLALLLALYHAYGFPQPLPFSGMAGTAGNTIRAWRFDPTHASRCDGYEAGACLSHSSKLAANTTKSRLSYPHHQSTHHHHSPW